MKLTKEELEIRTDFLIDDLSHAEPHSDLERKIIQAHIIKWHGEDTKQPVEQRRGSGH